MQLFKVGDRVVVLPQFAHLHQTDPGVVIEVQLDPFRPMFNEYKIEFPDRTTASLFEFQIGEATD